MTASECKATPDVHAVILDTPKHEHNASQARIPVLLPDMFVSFLARRPRVNPHYAKVRKESEEWINSKCNFDQRMRKRICSTDFSLFCAISAPEAGPEELRTMCDWGNWARDMMESLLSIMQNKEALQPKTSLVEVHDTVWRRISTTSSVGVRRRFYKAMKNYCNGAIEHVDRESQSQIPTIVQQLATRRRSAGVTPLFALIEYAHQLDLPDEVFNHPSIKEIERIGTDLVVLQNDILSYGKEEAEGVNHNLVAICRMNGMPAQQAFDRISELLKDCYRDWYRALADLPQWGEKIDIQVQKYIQGVQDVVLANLNWSFKSQRYLGEMHDVVRQTRQITVLPRPEIECAVRQGERRFRSPQSWRAKLVGASCVILMLLASVGLSFSTTAVSQISRFKSL